jgi:hypothetical protein
MKKYQIILADPPWSYNDNKLDVAVWFRQIPKLITQLTRRK